MSIRDLLHKKNQYLSLNNFDMTCVCNTLRSWLNEIPTMIGTFSPGLENNNKLKCIANNFPGITCMSACLENCLKHISMYRSSPIQGRRSKFLLKVRGRFVPYLFYFLGPSPLDKRTKINWKGFPKKIQECWKMCHSCNFWGTSFNVLLFSNLGEKVQIIFLISCSQDLRVYASWNLTIRKRNLNLF